MSPIHKSAGLARHPHELRLLLLAVFLHIFLALTIQMVGSFALIPQDVDYHGMFTNDSLAYRANVIYLTETFHQSGFLAWLNVPSHLHVRLYSLCYIATGSLFSLNVLAVEPLNLFYYLLTLSLIYTIGREVFGRRAGMLAASIVAFWPSFLLHTFQLLKDPLYITCILALILLLVSCLTRSYSLRAGVVLGVLGAILTLLLWPVRSNMWELTPVFIGMATLMLALRQLHEKRLSFGNIVCVILLILACFGFPDLAQKPEAMLPVAPSNSYAGSIHINGQMPAPEAKPATASYLSFPEAGLEHTARRINMLRYHFIEEYTGAGSNIDNHVQFNGAGDVFRYLPRAMLIGFFSPFPNMWLSPGKEVGQGGKLLAAFETSLMYLNFPLMLFGLWKANARWGAGLLIMISIVAMSALGMIVTNIGALYRMRMAFWMLLALIGANGILHLREAMKYRGATSS